MVFLRKILILTISVIMLFSLTACDPVDKNFGVNSEQAKDSADTVFEADRNYKSDNPIMSSDRVMPKYFDISLFDEENYSDIYLGKKFEINAVFLGKELVVPTKLHLLEQAGWKLAEGNEYNANSLVFAYETIDAVFINEQGIKIDAQFYNSSRSSVKLSECYIVKFKIDNNFYHSNDEYNSFNINGITNHMAVTDIIYTLGTPSHFYKVSDSCYYLDYFITKKDRRNGITVYINPIDDVITAIEFSYYK